jgi:hypothetical protein
MFITPDSIVQDPFDPQTLNRYAYARNNPLTYTDPSGHSFLGVDILVGAAIGAAIGGSYAAITGGDIGKGILTGAISGACFGFLGGYVAGVNELAAISNSTFQVEMAGASLLEETALHATAGAVSGAINTAISGGSIGLGALTGGLSAGVANYTGGVLPQDIATQFTSRTVMGGLSGGITTELSGGSFVQGFKYGAGSAAYGYFCNHLGTISIIRLRAYIKASVKPEDLLLDFIGHIFNVPTGWGILASDFLAPRDAGVANESDLILEWEMKHHPERFAEINAIKQELGRRSLALDVDLIMKHNSGTLYYRQGK